MKQKILHGRRVVSVARGEQHTNDKGKSVSLVGNKKRAFCLPMPVYEFL